MKTNNLLKTFEKNYHRTRYGDNLDAYIIFQVDS